MTALAAETTARAATPTGKPETHEWVGAATVNMTLAQAKRADLRGSIRVPEQTRIDVLDTYCRNCRRPFEDVAGKTCEAAKSKEHLIGGPSGVRQKRTGHGIPGHDCVALGCNTAGAYAAQREAAARRNGVVPDIRPVRMTAPPSATPPENAPALKPAAEVVSISTAVKRPPCAMCTRLPRKKAARRPDPMALTLW